jgi:hypothetical protein
MNTAVSWQALAFSRLLCHEIIIISTLMEARDIYKKIVVKKLKIKKPWVLTLKMFETHLSAIHIHCKQKSNNKRKIKTTFKVLHT